MDAIYTRLCEMLNPFGVWLDLTRNNPERLWLIRYSLANSRIEGVYVVSDASVALAAPNYATHYAQAILGRLLDRLEKVTAPELRMSQVDDGNFALTGGAAKQLQAFADHAAKRMWGTKELEEADEVHEVRGQPEPGR